MDYLSRLINLQNETREVMNIDFYMTHLKKQVGCTNNILFNRFM